ncbi:MAG: hypothetical protein U0X87_10620 [Anaerolineales bacterium]
MIFFVCVERFFIPRSPPSLSLRDQLLLVKGGQVGVGGGRRMGMAISIASDNLLAPISGTKQA